MGTQLLILECSDHVTTVHEHVYSIARGQLDTNTWVAGPLKVVKAPPPGNVMHFLLQLIQKADCDVTMSLVHASNTSSSPVWVSPSMTQLIRFKLILLTVLRGV